MSIKTNPFAKVLFDAARNDEQKIQAIVQLLIYDVKKTPEQNQKRIGDFDALMDHLKQERRQISGGIFQALQGIGPAEKEEPQPKKNSLSNLMDAVKSEGVGRYFNGLGKQLDELIETNNKIKRDYELLEAAAREASRISKEQRDTLITSMDSHIASTNAAAKEAQSISEHIKEVAARLKTMLTDKDQYAKAGKKVTTEVTKTAETVTKKATVPVARGALKAAWFLTKIASGAAINAAKPKNPKGPGNR